MDDASIIDFTRVISRGVPDLPSVSFMGLRSQVLTLNIDSIRGRKNRDYDMADQLRDSYARLASCLWKRGTHEQHETREASHIPAARRRDTGLGRMLLLEKQAYRLYICITNFQSLRSHAQK